MKTMVTLRPLYAVAAVATGSEPMSKQGKKYNNITRLCDFTQRLALAVGIHRRLQRLWLQQHTIGRFVHSFAVLNCTLLMRHDATHGGEEGSTVSAISSVWWLRQYSNMALPAYRFG